MATDTLALNLKGEVTLDLFAKALRYFDLLVNTLTYEVVGEYGRIKWEVSHLEGGSARMVVKALPSNGEPVVKVVDAFTEVATALERRQAIPYSDDVARYAMQITSVIDGYISEVDFVTDKHTATIRERINEQPAKQYSIGEVIGTVRTVTDRPKLRMMIFDQVYRKLVYCNIEKGQEEFARQAWRNRVSVTGLMHRHPTTGSPIQIRRAVHMEILPAVDMDLMEQISGAIPWMDGDEPSDVIIERLRDAV